MNWHEVQTTFATAVRDPALKVPDSVGKTRGQPSLKRFNVYRNNGVVSLTGVLSATYPVVAELVGEEFFAAMARGFIDHDPPTSPVMLFYGQGFPVYIEAFEPAASLPFLADVARVEWAWGQAYHAADQVPCAIEDLQALAPDKLATVQIELHPSLHLLHSGWSAISIWSAHQLEGQARQDAMAAISPAPEHGLIVRPGLDVDVQRTAGEVTEVLKALQNGATLGEAAEQASIDGVEAFGSLLNYIFSIGAVGGFRQRL